MSKTNIPSCKRFNGYKPCFPEYNCLEHGCRDNLPIGTKILIVNLDAMGDVLMTTAHLPAIKRKFPNSTIYWITNKESEKLLFNNQYVDYVYKYEFDSILILQQMKFDYIYGLDKSNHSAALVSSINAKHKLGFELNEDGVVVPLNKGANYNYMLGLDDNLKFKVNKRTKLDYVAETLDLDYQRDEYVFNLTEEEIAYTNAYKKKLGVSEDDFVIGFNTGCSEKFPNKKMSIYQHVYLIDKLLKHKKFRIILLGGPEDRERNAEIFSHFQQHHIIINSPVHHGVRKGACYESIADVVITGDSFGMHLAIALKKYVVAWFGLSCWTEIDLYDRGIKLFSENLFCSPCWKVQCPYNLECISMIDLDKMEKDILRYYENHPKSKKLTKPIV
jgi:heptosyltransferase-2